MSEDEEREWSELGTLGEEYKDILLAINRKFRKELRKVGVRKNVVPSRIILPKVYISRLLKYPLFRRTWERKTFYSRVVNEFTGEKKWLKVKTFPNLGGIPVEEGPELKVEVIKSPRRQRPRKK